MRLIAWNANFNSRKNRSLDDNARLLSVFYPDVIVLSETALPLHSAHLSDKSIAIGETNPGLAVMAFGPYTIKRSELNTGAPELSCLVHVDGPVPFVLLALWPVDRDKKHPYHQTLMRNLDYFGASLSRAPAIMAGDFNSSARVKDQVDTHPQFIEKAHNLGIESVYHHHTGEPHGAELLNTYVHGKEQPQPFHIDYCFVSRSLIRASTVTIPQSQEWSQVSDHFPLILDIPDRALQDASTDSSRAT